MSSSDVTARLGEQTMTVFTGDEIRKQLIEERNSDEFWSDVATGLAVVGAVAGGVRAAYGHNPTGALVTSALVADSAESLDNISEQALKTGVKGLNGYLRTTIEPGKWGSGYVEIDCPDGVEDEKKPIHIVINLAGENVVFQYMIEEIQGASKSSVRLSTTDVFRINTLIKHGLISVTHCPYHLRIIIFIVPVHQAALLILPLYLTGPGDIHIFMDVPKSAAHVYTVKNSIIQLGGIR